MKQIPIPSGLSYCRSTLKPTIVILNEVKDLRVFFSGGKNWQCHEAKPVSSCGKQAGKEPQILRRCAPQDDNIDEGRL